MQLLRLTPLRTHAWIPLLAMLSIFFASGALAQGACPGEGDPCDGLDSDLCAEGVIVCDGDLSVCDDESGDELEACDGFDNDCNPATADGSDEPNLGLACDGNDSDLCEEGVILCIAGGLTCNDTSGDSLDTCDGLDNDCDVTTPDGADDPAVGVSCDGFDVDLCADDLFTCLAGLVSCTDVVNDNSEICDGLDNDCNASTADGSQDPLLGQACDGPDTDLCTEGSFSCVNESMSCSDTTGHTLDLCDGTDNDCNASTPDGVDEPGHGASCDGPDSDLCEEGVVECIAATLVCTDDTGDDPVCAPAIPSRTPVGIAVLVSLLMATAGLVLVRARRSVA